MKKIAIATVLATASAGSIAAPFLVCDPYPATGPQPTDFVITVGTAAPITVPAFKEADGDVILKWDVGTLTGAKTLTVKAKNSWGESAATAPFSFVAGAPGPAAGMRLVP